MKNDPNMLDLKNRPLSDIRPSKSGKGGGFFMRSIAKKVRLFRNNKKLFRATGLVIILVVCAFFIQNYMSTRDALKKASDPAAAVQAEAKKLAKEVGKYLELPQEETPTVATVKNIEQLKDQSFFERANNGDKVLIYPVAKRAVLYRPSTHKVIEYAPVESTPKQ